MEEKLLKDRLKKVKKNGYVLTSEMDLSDMTESMLFNIGNPDPELRDELIYTTFYYWIIEKKFYSNKELKQILHTVLDDDHLFYMLGNNGDDTVFVRSFSSLLLALLIARQFRDDYFSKKDFVYLKKKFFDYYQKEEDHRGYLLKKGWAHSAAHGADVLAELTFIYFIETDDLKTILRLLREKTFTDKYVFVNEEDERMVTAVMRVIESDIIARDYILDWIESFAGFEMPEETYLYHRLISNIKGFLRSLYFRTVDEKEFCDINEKLQELIKRLNKFADNS